MIQKPLYEAIKAQGLASRSLQCGIENDLSNKDKKN